MMHDLRFHRIWIGPGLLVAVLSTWASLGLAEGLDDEMSRQPNRSIIADGVGRLPQFSHATVAGDLIFVSGTLGTLPDSFELAPGGTGPQTRQTLENISKILRTAGADLGDVVKVSVYLADMNTFREMNAAYSEFFSESPPARITVGGAELALDAAVEIECIARHVP